LLDFLFNILFLFFHNSSIFSLGLRMQLNKTIQNQIKNME